MKPAAILYVRACCRFEDIVAIRETRPGVGALSVALTTFESLVGLWADQSGT